MNGFVYSWGNNSFGGLGREGDSSVPKMVELGDRIQFLASGQHHVVALV